MVLYLSLSKFDMCFILSQFQNFWHICQWHIVTRFLVASSKGGKRSFVWRSVFSGTEDLWTYLSHHLKHLQSTGAMDPSKSISTNKVNAEQKFCTISLEEDRQIIESVPIISIPQSVDTADDSPEPVLRGSPQQANCDVFRFPPLPKIPQNVTKVIQSVPWIFPLAYCVAFLLLLLSV